MITEAEAVAMVKTLRGAGLACLIILCCVRRPLRVNDLVVRTGYKRDAVREGLELLEIQGLAQRNGPRDRWQLTDQGFQLPLFNSGAALHNDGISVIEASSSCCFKESEEIKESINNNNYMRLYDDGNSVIPEEAAPLIQKLRAKGCDGKRAEAALSEALIRGDDLADISTEIDLWLAYCASPVGKGVGNAGFFTASKVRKGELCPVEPEPEPEPAVWYAGYEAIFEGREAEAEAISG